MKYLLHTAFLAAILICTVEATSCKRSVPYGCDKKKVCEEKGCPNGQTCVLACGTCRPLCIGECKENPIPCFIDPCDPRIKKCRADEQCVQACDVPCTGVCTKKCNACSTIICNLKIKERCLVTDQTNCKARCVCPSQCTREYRPVCGSNGVTYGNQCLLDIATCTTGGRVTHKHDGECKAVCIPGSRDIQCPPRQWCSPLGTCDLLPACPPTNERPPSQCGQTILVFCTPNCRSCCLSGNNCTPGGPLAWILGGGRCGVIPPLLPGGK